MLASRLRASIRCGLVLTFLGLAPLALAAIGDTERVSVSSSGAQGDGDCSDLALSSDGRIVAFVSSATNLVNLDTNDRNDVFVHDRRTGSTERVSVSSGGAQANGDSTLVSLSADGWFVAFVSDATNLVSGDTNGRTDVFLHDRRSDLVERVSVGSGRTQANGDSTSPSVTSDGWEVAFASLGTNLVAGDTNDRSDVFVHDRRTENTERVSVSSNDVQGDRDSFGPSISSDGRYVAFVSAATNLVSGDTNERSDIFVRDRRSGATRRVSVSSGGTQANGDSTAVSISSDGRYVAFLSAASNLVAGDTNARSDIFVHDRQTSETRRVSVSTSGEQGNGSPLSLAISPDGRYVAFVSPASNLVDGDTNNFSDVFVRDREAGTTTMVSVSSSDIQGNRDSFAPAVASDGTFIAFGSFSTNLVPADTNGRSDVYVHEFADEPAVQVSVGCQVNPSAGMGLEWLLLIGLLAALRRRAKGA